MTTPTDLADLGLHRAQRFTAGSEGDGASVVASLDPRQRVGAGQVGTIGFIETGVATGRATLGRALSLALTWLADEGADLVRCPVNGSTWNGHRAIVDGFAERGGLPAFVLEPRTGPALPEALAELGFAPVLHGVSNLARTDRVVATTRAALGRAEAAGFRDRPLRVADQQGLAADLAILHSLSSAIFRPAWGFSDVSCAEFEATFRPLLPIVDPELTRILEDPAGRAVGFVFGVPDRLGPPAGDPAARFVLKTVGVLADMRRVRPGLGSALLARAHLIALSLGYPNVIHALMTVGSYAERLSSGWGAPFRRYSTFERHL